MTNRRTFLKTVSLCTGVYLLQPDVYGSTEVHTPLRFGLIADVHQDVMHDGERRISAFAAAMNDAKADFVAQLGDFCQPDPRNRPFLERWRQFDGPRFHVLGNHDMDGGYTQEQTVQFLAMPGKHYSIDIQGVHVVVLNGNDPGGTSQGYQRYVGPQQLEWLREDLEATSLPAIVLSHQAIDSPSGVENSDDVRAVLEAANAQAGRLKVVACFCGHHHDDQARQINGIHYIRINSASYSWLGGDFKHESYAKEIHEKYPWISYTAPYRDPLWAMVELDLGKGRLVVTGRESVWVGPTPWELGMDEKMKDPKIVGPRISDRELLLRHQRES